MPPTVEARGGVALVYAVGDRIVYPLHGAGIIEAIEQRDLLGRTEDYYVVRLLVGDLRALIPVHRAGAAGLRPVADRTAIECALRAARDAAESQAGYGERLRENSARLRAGDVDSVAQVLGSLSRRRQRRGLAAGEAKLFEQAWQILMSEVALSARIPPERAEAFLREAVG